MPLTPKNRKEEWLEGFVQHETTLTPKNREEAWAKEIIDASGGGGTGGGVGCIYICNCYIFFLDRSFDHYVVTIFVSFHSLYFSLFYLI